MMRATQALLLRLAGAACIGLALASAAHAAQPKDLDVEVAALSKKLLADPLDASAERKLTELRKQQHEQRIQALMALEKGLQAYLAGRPGIAAQELQKAEQSAKVVAMADRVLPVPVAKLVEKCLDEPRRPAGRRPQGACLYCGDTGWADCPACGGCGIRLCPDCQGTGKIARWDGVARIPKCNRTGALPCEQCKGKGAVPCGKCDEIPEAAVRAGAGGMEAKEAEALRRAVETARYARAGGIDFGSRRSLRPAPKTAD